MDSCSRTDTVTFLFTDIEGSTRLWEQEAERMRSALACHDALLRATVESNHGAVVKMIGDGVHAAFDDPLDAVRATVAIQCALADATMTNGVAFQVRYGLHVGAVERRDNDFFGSQVNRAARIMSAAHGGQVLLSQAVVDRVRDRLPAEISLRDLGRVRLRDLTSPEHVYQLLHRQLRPDFPALRSLEAIPNNLPQQVTSFIGRERELAEVPALLEGARLLTLLGVGGIGKTRLSLQIGANVMDAYPDGVWLVDLAPLVDATFIANAVARVLAVREEAGQPLPETLCRHLRGRRLLLILDNCEHLLDGCTQLVDAVLRAAAEPKIMATSREPLRLAGEQTYPLPTLSLPAPGASAEAIGRSEAVHLFVERGRLQQPGFVLTERQAPTVAALCAHLDGIPLALELAAARIRTLSVEDINARLGDRFRLLSGGSRNTLPRQQTLRALIDWSFDLLADEEQTLFARLAAFAGGWTLDAAEAVVAGNGILRDDVVDLLASLVDKSLVVADDDSNRFRLLETIRAYAREQLQGGSDEAAANDRHLSYFLTFAETAALALRGGPEAPKWMERLDLEHDNVQAALGWSVGESKTLEAAARLCWALYRFWLRRGHWREGRKWCDAVLARDAGEIGKASRARVLLVAGGMAERLGQAAESKALCEQTLALSQMTGDRHVEARALNLLSMSYLDQGDFARAQSLLEQAIRINRELGDRVAEISNVGNLGLLFVHQGNLAAAREPLERELALSLELNDRYYEASAHRHLGSLAYQREDYVAAHAFHERALTIFRELRAPAGEVEQLRNLAETAVARGELATAVAMFGDALRAHRDLDYRHSAADCFDGMVGLAVKTGAYVEATKFCGAMDALREAVGAVATPSEVRRNSGYRVQCRDVLGDLKFEAAYVAGRSLTTDTAIEEALAWLRARS